MEAKKMLKSFMLRSAGIALLSAPAMVMAAETGPDLSGLTSNFSVTTVVTGVLAIAAGLATLYLAIKGAKILLQMIRG